MNINDSTNSSSSTKEEERIAIEDETTESCSSSDVGMNPTLQLGPQQGIPNIRTQQERLDRFVRNSDARDRQLRSNEPGPSRNCHANTTTTDLQVTSIPPAASIYNQQMLTSYASPAEEPMTTRDMSILNITISYLALNPGNREMIFEFVRPRAVNCTLIDEHGVEQIILSNLSTITLRGLQTLMDNLLGVVPETPAAKYFHKFYFWKNR